MSAIGIPPLEEMLRSWESQPQEAATKTIERYGPPDEITPSRLIWHQRGPWKRTIVYRDKVPHRFPKPHNDLLEQSIDYRVPVEKASEVAAFDGSVIVERTKGEVSARCDKEEMNFLALNLMHDIIRGKLGVDEARRVYTETAGKFMMGQHDAYTKGLHFQVPSEGTADPDETTIAETLLHKAGEKLGLEE